MHGDSLLDEFRAFIRQEVTAFISRFEDMERTVKSQTRYLISHRRRLNEQEEAIAYLKGHNKGLISRMSKLEAELKAMAEIVHRHQETLENMDHDPEPSADHHQADDLRHLLRRSLSFGYGYCECGA
jgi:phage regulator Rha-like protein